MARQIALGERRLPLEEQGSRPPPPHTASLRSTDARARECRDPGRASCVQEPPKRDPARDEKRRPGHPKNATIPISNGQFEAAITTPNAAISAASIRNLGKPERDPICQSSAAIPTPIRATDHRYTSSLTNAEAPIAPATNSPSSATQTRSSEAASAIRQNRPADTSAARGLPSPPSPPRRYRRRAQAGSSTRTRPSRYRDKSERSLAQTHRAVRDNSTATPISCSPSTFQ